MVESVTPQTEEEPPRLRTLRRMVMTLTIVMILGMVSLVGLLFWRLMAAPEPPLPAQITVPPGETLQSVSTGDGWVYILTRTDDGAQRLHLLRRGSDRIHQSIEIEAGG